ncbi:hypothetical protein M8J76_010472 [Diaphorina citri]|nr:hypothetical protein M8J76_010472 [Diaphorina citri]
MYPFTRKHHSPTSLKRNSKSAGKPTNSRGASREENEMTCEEYSVYLQDIVKSRRQASSPVKSSSLRQKEEILLTSLRGRTVDCDNSTRLGPNKQYLFEHLLQTDPSCSRNDQEVFQSVPQLAVYDLSPNSIRPNETMWRRKSDSNALPCSKDVPGLVNDQHQTQRPKLQAQTSKPLLYQNIPQNINLRRKQVRSDLPDILYDIDEKSVEIGEPNDHLEETNVLHDEMGNEQNVTCEQFQTTDDLVSLASSSDGSSDEYETEKENSQLGDQNQFYHLETNMRDSVPIPSNIDDPDQQLSTSITQAHSNVANSCPRLDLGGSIVNEKSSTDLENNVNCEDDILIKEKNENIVLQDTLSKTDGALNAPQIPSDHATTLNMDMMHKLLEIKSKWKQLCENIAALNEDGNFEEIDHMFQSIGLSLETPKVKTRSEKQISEKGQEVKSIPETFGAGNESQTQPGDKNHQTFSQIYIKYKKNKNMVTGMQVPLHRVMSTLFDPKKLKIQYMKKWLNVDNSSKRFVCGMKGVMSIVHAFSMKNELFAFKNGVKSKRSDCGPYDGLADIIWQAGDGSSAIVVEYEPQFSHTRIFECLDAKMCFNINEVRSQLASVYTTPQPPISLILSVILTRGLDRVQTDLSNSKVKTLLTQDGDETWSLILLLLIGQAVGHIMHSQFPKNWNPVRSPIGILSLDEYGEKVYVSPFFKTPRFPLWLIHYCHDGNHYSLLFGHCKQLLSDWKEEKNFTLHHWDFDDEEMKTVQIRTTGRITQDPDEVKDVLEMIVRTKWPIANIDIKSSVGNPMGLSAEQFPSLRRKLFSKYSDQSRPRTFSYM